MGKGLFHLALPCNSITSTKHFYVDILGAQLGRSTQQWVDVDLFGHQITFTKSGNFQFDYRSYKFEDEVLPSFHFGVILEKAIWQDVYRRLQASNHEITTEVVFLKNKVGEHVSFFIQDPNNYTVEFKTFTNGQEVFKL